MKTYRSDSTHYQQRITIEPGKRGGKPCIRGLRITVYDVLDCLARGMNHQEIIDDFPELENEDILACLAFAADRERHIMQNFVSTSSNDDSKYLPPKTL